MLRAADKGMQHIHEQRAALAGFAIEIVIQIIIVVPIHHRQIHHAGNIHPGHQILVFPIQRAHFRQEIIAGGGVLIAALQHGAGRGRGGGRLRFLHGCGQDGRLRGLGRSRRHGLRCFALLLRCGRGDGLRMQSLQFFIGALTALGRAEITDQLDQPHDQRRRAKQDAHAFPVELPPGPRHGMIRHRAAIAPFSASPFLPWISDASHVPLRRSGGHAAERNEPAARTAGLFLICVILYQFFRHFSSSFVCIFVNMYYIFIKLSS